MSYQPGQSYTVVFATSAAGGQAQNGDTTPTVTAYRNGVADAGFPLAVSNLGTGLYEAVGTVPAGYARGDVVWVIASALVSTVPRVDPVDAFLVSGVYGPSSAYYAMFTTGNAAGGAQNADGAPSVSAYRNGVVDPAFTLVVSNPATAVYLASGVIPAGYSPLDSISTVARATVAGTAGDGVVDAFLLGNTSSASSDLLSAVVQYLLATSSVTSLLGASTNVFDDIASASDVLPWVLVEDYTEALPAETGEDQMVSLRVCCVSPDLTSARQLGTAVKNALDSPNENPASIRTAQLSFTGGATTGTQRNNSRPYRRRGFGSGSKYVWAEDIDYDFWVTPMQ